MFWEIEFFGFLVVASDTALVEWLAFDALPTILVYLFRVPDRRGHRRKR